MMLETKFGDIMKKQPLVSIIVPVYKVEQYLKKCVDSIINQTYKNLEIILVDDGSPDSCPKMCDDLAKTDKRIKVIHKENGGLSSARNAGTDIATGDLLMYVDSDDYIELNTVEVLHDNMVKTDSDVSFADYAFVYEDDAGKSITENKLTTYTKSEIIKRFALPGSVYFAVAWCKLYKREVVGDIRFPAGKLHEDEFTTYKILFNAKKVVRTNSTLYRYLQRSGSIMQNKTDKNHLHLFEAAVERLEFYKKNAPDEYKEFASNYLNTIIYANMFLQASKKFNDKKKIKQQTKQVLKSYKEDGITIKSKFKVWLRLNFPKLMVFLNKQKNKNKRG